MQYTLYIYICMYENFMAFHNYFEMQIVIKILLIAMISSLINYFNDEVNAHNKLLVAIKMVI